MFIDACGGALGIFAVYILEATIAAMDRKVQEDLKNPKLNK